MSLKDDLLRDFSDGFSKRAEDSLNSSFLNNRVSWTNEVINGYMRYGTDPNELITKLANTHNLNEEQTQRIVEETNVGIYLQKYAMTKGKRIRRVSFPLADLNKIKGNGIKTASSNSTIYDESSLEKAASSNVTTPGYNKGGINDMNFSLGEKEANNMFTNTVELQPKIWGDTVEKTAATALKSKLNARNREARLEKLAEVKELLNNIAVVGDALIHNESRGQSAQKLLGKIASDACLSPSEQLPFIRYTNEKVASLITHKVLPSSFRLELTPVSTNNSSFSLGKHSLMKEASSEEDLRLPDRVQYGDIIDIAKEVKKKLAEKEQEAIKNKM